MEAFGIIGMSLGTLAFIFSLNAQARLAKLEKQLEESKSEWPAPSPS